MGDGAGTGGAGAMSWSEAGRYTRRSAGSWTFGSGLARTTCVFGNECPVVVGLGRGRRRRGEGGCSGMGGSVGVEICGTLRSGAGSGCVGTGAAVGTSGGGAWETGAGGVGAGRGRAGGVGAGSGGAGGVTTGGGARFSRIVERSRRVCTSVVLSGQSGELLLGFWRAAMMSWAAAAIMSVEEAIGMERCCGNHARVSAMQSRCVAQTQMQ